MLARLPYFKFARVGLIATLVTPAMAAPPEAPGQAESATVHELRQDLNRAMEKSLNERVPALEQLEGRMKQAANRGGMAPKKRVATLDMLYRTRLNLGKYSKAHEAFGQYAEALRSWHRGQRAATVLVERIRETHLDRRFPEAEAQANAAMPHWQARDGVRAAMLYYKAESLREIPGRAKEALPIYKRIIGQYPDSPYRPRAMRGLAVLQAAGLENEDAAYQTLKIMQREYRGTQWEHWGHMMKAVIKERREGKPQVALERFRSSLDKFPDHAYALFCRAQIKRLKDVIEQQLIDDALQGVKRNPDPSDHGPHAPGGAHPTIARTNTQDSHAKAAVRLSTPGSR